MSLLLLFNNQVAPVSNQVVPTTQILLETSADTMVDVSTDFEMWTTTRGRNRELDRFQAGTAQVQLLDTSRKYDPSNTAGPYYPNLKPMRQVQITATWNGTTYPQFTGYVDSFESQYDGPPNGNAVTTIYATDGFKVLEAADLASSSYAQEVLADNPAHWWRLGEPTGATVFFDEIAGLNFTVGVGKNLPAAGADGLVSRDADTAATFTELNSVQVVAPAGSAPSGSEYTVEFLIKTPLPASTTRSILFWRDSAGLNDTQASISGGADAGALYWDVTNTSAIVADDSPHHVALVQTATQKLLYIDGALADTENSTNLGYSGGKMYLGAATTNNFGGTLDEVVVYNTALTAARVLAHSSARATPWNGDTPGARIGRVLDAAAWPANLRQLDTGTSTLQSATLDEMTTLEHAQKTAESDFGVLFMKADGRVRFIGRAGLFNLAELATFGDGGGAELGYVSLRPELTDQLIRNDVTVSRLEGTAQNVKDTTSISTYLRHSYTADGLYHNDDTLSRAAAEFIISEFKDPQRRISGMVVAPRGDPSNLFPKVLGLELEDQITVKDRPPGGGTANTQDTTIEGISHTVTPLWWETTWNLAPSFGSQGTPVAVGQWDVTLWDQCRWGF